MSDPDIVDIVTMLRSPDRFEPYTCNAAADEIERLRVIVQGWEHSSRNAERDITELRAERDEARRSVCEMSIQLGGVYRRVGGKTVEVTTAEGCAEIMRWDCFKENTDD